MTAPMAAPSPRRHPPGPEHTQPAQLALAEDLTPPPTRGGPDMTIGEVLTALLADFPELTVSKIRYYERQGLLRPARSAAGYRKFTAADLARLHYILMAARDQYLPLKVIRERLETADASGTDPALVEYASPEPLEAPERGEPPAARSGLGVGPELFDFETSDTRLTRRELMRDSGLDNEQLTELEAYGLIAPRGSSTTYEAEALVIARIVAELSAYGFQARHLRPVKAAVDREVGLIEQVLTPMVRQPSREGRGRAETRAREYASLSVRLHIALLEAALRATLR